MEVATEKISNETNPGKICRNEDCKADTQKVVSSTASLRFHDLRHPAITELAESKTSDQTSWLLQGTCLKEMLAHYPHVQLEAKRTALDALGGEGKTDGYDTNNDTKALPAATPNPQVVEINGRPVGLEPQTSLPVARYRADGTSRQDHLR
jgi:hypothetical protein